MNHHIDPTQPLAAQLHAHNLYLHQGFRDGGVLLCRFWSADDLLYVGITVNPGIRWQRHKNTAVWWPFVTSVSVERHEHEGFALIAERAAIKTENPIYNRRSAPKFSERLSEQISERRTEQSVSGSLGEWNGREEERNGAENALRFPSSAHPSSPKRSVSNARGHRRLALEC